MQKTILCRNTAYLAIALCGLIPSVGFVAKVPPYLPPWRYFQHSEHRSGLGITTLGGSPGATSLASGSYYGGSALSAGPANTSVTWKGHVVVGDTGGTLHSINFNGGTQTSWTASLGDAIYSTPAIGNLNDFDDVFVGCDDDKIYRYSKTGTQRTTYTTGGNVRSSPILDEPNSLLFVGSDDGYVYALTVGGFPSYGLSTAWTYATGDKVRSSAAIVGSGTSAPFVLIGSDDDKLYCIWTTTNGLHTAGQLKWSYTTGGDIQGSAMFSSTTGYAYCGSADGYVYAIQGNGTLAWSRNLGTATYSSPALSADQSTVYIGCDDGYIYALDSSTGAVNWSYATGGVVRTGVAVLSDGRVVAGSDDGYLYVLTSAGALSTSYNASSPVRSSPSVGHPSTLGGSTGPVFFGTTGGAIYKFQ